ncbi:MAG: DUF1674 domain-containing protein [Gammaproteobacteria bacterium]|nr:DUF1674 domain-containing protein [Gammaproteobacteria bacterium]
MNIKPETEAANASENAKDDSNALPAVHQSDRHSENRSDIIVPETAADSPQSADRKRLDPTRYGDWEKDGRCIDF